MWQANSALALVVLYISVSTCYEIEHLRKRHSNHLHERGCEKRFVRYVPSPFEEYWLSNAGGFEANVCSHIMEPDQLDKFKVWLHTTDAIAREERGTCGPIRKELESNPNLEVFSYLEYQYECAHAAHPLHGTTIKETIEPLAGYLREPRPLCRRMYIEGGVSGAVKTLDNKDFIVYKSRRCSEENTPVPRLIIVDIGATQYDFSLSGPSQKYFYELYRDNGFTVLERLLGWEAKSYNAERMFDKVPAEVLPHYQFFNRKCSGVEGDKHNPMTFIKAIARPEDFVLVKLDVDQRDVEWPIVHQILNDTSLSSLIDEFMWEHHSTVPDLKWAWAKGNAIQGSLADGYNVFRKMREIGIRAHSWI